MTLPKTPLSPAGGAGFLNDLPLTSAAGTGNHLGKLAEGGALDVLHLAGTAAGGAGYRGTPLLRPGTATAMALFPPGDGDLTRSSETDILKLAGEFHLKIRPPTGSIGVPGTPSAKEGLEDISEDIPKGTPSGTAETTEGVPLLFSHETELIVLSLFLRITQNFVGFAYLLETLLRILISRIGIGMILTDELAVGSLNLLRSGVTGDFKDFVIITL
jgi:hypothetical protein